MENSSSMQAKARDEDCSDMELIRAFGRGDESAFETLYHRYRRQLYGFLNNLIPGNPAEVDEVFEESWLRVIEKLPHYRDEGRFSAWLFRLSRNLFIDRVRREARNGGHFSLNAEDAPDVPGAAALQPAHELDSAEIDAAIREAVGKLPPEQREVFLLRQQEFSFKEIAEMQNCPVNTALGRMQYALKSLRRMIRDIDEGGLIS